MPKDFKVSVYDRENFLKKISIEYADLRKNAQWWQEELQEREEWEMIADLLEDI